MLRALPGQANASACPLTEALSPGCHACVWRMQIPNLRWDSREIGAEHQWHAEQWRHYVVGWFLLRCGDNGFNAFQRLYQRLPFDVGLNDDFCALCGEQPCIAGELDHIAMALLGYQQDTFANDLAEVGNTCTYAVDCGP